MKIDWSILAREMGTLIDSRSEIGGSDLGTQVIEQYFKLLRISRYV
jgi:hypothetical protein